MQLHDKKKKKTFYCKVKQSSYSFNNQPLPPVLKKKIHILLDLLLSKVVSGVYNFHKICFFFFFFT